MGLYDLFESNADLERDGVWIEVDDGVGFLIARAGGANKKYRRAVERMTRPYKHQVRKGTMAPEMLTKLAQQAFIEACLLDWKGVTNRDGKTLQCNEKNAQNLFDDLPDVYELLSEAAGSMATYRDEEVEEAGES